MTIGGLVLVLGLLSSPIKNRTPFFNPPLAPVVGIVLGPAGFGVPDPARWGAQETILRQTTRLTLAIGLMGVALRLPPRYFQHHWRSMGALIGLVMPFMWGSSSLLAYLLLGGT